MSGWKEVLKVVVSAVASAVLGAVACKGVDHVYNKCANSRITQNGGRVTSGGTPDNRFTTKGKTKKDGTLDMRYKENW